MKETYEESGPYALSVQLGEGLQRRLEKFKERTGVSKSDAIRLALDEYLNSGDADAS